MLRAMRRLRGTALDLFGLPKVRRVERELIGEYRAMAERSLAHLTPETAPLVLEICDLPDEIRGYEEIKLRSVKRFRMTAERLERKLARAASLEAAA
jgi:indolepyruvate ferredoxin oxidoreductase